MQFTHTAVSFLFITFLFSIPSKQDFSDSFIKVAEKGNPAVVSIVSEKTMERSFHYFFGPFTMDLKGKNARAILWVRVSSLMQLMAILSPIIM